MGVRESDSGSSIAVRFGVAPADLPGADEGGSARVGMWIFLATDAMGFGGMLVAYGVLRARASTWPDSMQRLSIPLAAGMTLALLTSSLTALMALAAARAGRARVARGWLAASVAGGLVFLAGQAAEYRNLLIGSSRMDLTTDLFASTFYAVTGFHGLHVLAGVAVLIAVAARGRRAILRASTIEVAVLFWHFVDFAWVPIFTFVYLLPVR
jgi:cytochrome c oxidase subunit 3